MAWLEGPQKVDEFILKEPTKFTGKSQNLLLRGKYDKLKWGSTNSYALNVVKTSIISK